MISDDKKTAASRFCEVFEVLPDTKKEWLIGYGEGMADAKRQLADDQKHHQHQEQTK